MSAISVLLKGRKMNHLRLAICALAIVGSSHALGAPDGSGHCDQADEGVFVNQDLNGRFSNAYVKVRFEPKNTAIFEVMIPCGSKLIPAVLSAYCNRGMYEQVEVVDSGGSQCSFGLAPKLYISGDRLTIYTQIRVPGFSGKYEFSRQR